MHTFPRIGKNVNKRYFDNYKRMRFVQPCTHDSTVVGNVICLFFVIEKKTGFIYTLNAKIHMITNLMQIMIFFFDFLVLKNKIRINECFCNR